MAGENRVLVLGLDGASWNVTTEEPGEPLGPYFRFVSDTIIYGIVGESVCKWE